MTCTGDIFVRYMKMPYSVYGTTVVDCDGNYNIYINTEICPKKQEVALKHELVHIQKNHFWDNESCMLDEYDAMASEKYSSRCKSKKVR